MSDTNFYAYLYDTILKAETTAVMDAKPGSQFKEKDHPREKGGEGHEEGGQFKTKPETIAKQDVIELSAPAKENEGVRSYTTKAYKEKGKWKEMKTDAKGKSLREDHDSFGKKGKHEKWLHLPPPPEKSEGNAFPNLATFADEEPRGNKISDIAEDDLYLRSDNLLEGGGVDGKPRYGWMRNGKPLSDEEANRLEGALKELGVTSALFSKNTNVRVRPDLTNGAGQLATYRNKEGKSSIQYGTLFDIDSSINNKYRTSVLYPVYDQIKERIYDGVRKDDPAAWLAYFMLRTKVRVGSDTSPEKGKGATDLARGDISLADDGETFYLSFNGKSNQWWHVTAKDKTLHQYLDKRKKTISGANANSTPMFTVSYGKLKEYLKSISEDLTGDTGVYFKPHDFRRCGATRVAEETLRESLKGVDPNKDRKKWEDRICKATIAAAQHLNDTPKVAFDTYILPSVLFNTSRADMLAYHPYMAEVEKRLGK